MQPVGFAQIVRNHLKTTQTGAELGLWEAFREWLDSPASSKLSLVPFLLEARHNIN